MKRNNIESVSIVFAFTMKDSNCSSYEALIHLSSQRRFVNVPQIGIEH